MMVIAEESARVFTGQTFLNVSRSSCIINHHRCCAISLLIERIHDTPVGEDLEYPSPRCQQEGCVSISSRYTNVQRVWSSPSRTQKVGLQSRARQNNNASNRVRCVKNTNLVRSLMNICIKWSIWNVWKGYLRLDSHPSLENTS
jgi:hypothetical protein